MPEGTAFRRACRRQRLAEFDVVNVGAADLVVRKSISSACCAAN
jgi:hypothetical protein